ncbi:hypothetical protein, partial [Flavobacterium agri]|uniref:hypothetical protein n=1 Tax=Flavobacterium agri TaxID=2743471 RepID=UPI001C377F53
QFFAFFQAFAASGTRLCDHGAGRRKCLLTFCLRAAQNECPREDSGKLGERNTGLRFGDWSCDCILVAKNISHFYLLQKCVKKFIASKVDTDEHGVSITNFDTRGVAFHQY